MILIKKLPCGEKLYSDTDTNGKRIYILRNNNNVCRTIWQTADVHRTVLLEAILAEDRYKYEEIKGE